MESRCVTALLSHWLASKAPRSDMGCSVSFALQISTFLKPNYVPCNIWTILILEILIVYLECKFNWVSCVFSFCLFVFAKSGNSSWRLSQEVRALSYHCFAPPRSGSLSKNSVALKAEADPKVLTTLLGAGQQVLF